MDTSISVISVRKLQWVILNLLLYFNLVYRRKRINFCSCLCFKNAHNVTYFHLAHFNKIGWLRKHILLNLVLLVREVGLEPTALTCIRRIPSPLGYSRKTALAGFEPANQWVKTTCRSTWRKGIKRRWQYSNLHSTTRMFPQISNLPSYQLDITMS